MVAADGHKKKLHQDLRSPLGREARWWSVEDAGINSANKVHFKSYKCGGENKMKCTFWRNFESGLLFRKSGQRSEIN